MVSNSWVSQERRFLKPNCALVRILFLSQWSIKGEHGVIFLQSKALPPLSPQSEGKMAKISHFRQTFLDFSPSESHFAPSMPSQKILDNTSLTTKLCICVSGLLGLGIASTVITLTTKLCICVSGLLGLGIASTVITLTTKLCICVSGFLGLGIASTVITLTTKLCIMYFWLA